VLRLTAPGAHLALQHLGMDKLSSKLIFRCSPLADNTTAGSRHLLENDDHRDHRDHHDHHRHDPSSRKLLGLPQAEEPLSAHQRALLQLVQANLADPTSYPTNPAGLPLPPRRHAQDLPRLLRPHRHVS
jgi:hypothetical protein